MKIPFNPGNRKTQAIVTAVVLLIVAGLATRCRAGDAVAQFSIGAAQIRGETEVADLAILYPDSGPGDAGYAFGVTFMGASTHYGVEQKPNFAVRAELIEGFRRFDVSLGIAYMQNEDIYNSGHGEFTLALGYRFKRWPVVLTIRHFSNGGTNMPNKGRDLALIGWQFR